jgi:hypothetical protein
MMESKNSLMQETWRIPCLKWLFANEETTKLMWWHVEECLNDGKIINLADGLQWRVINFKFKKSFVSELVK